MQSCQMVKSAKKDNGFDLAGTALSLVFAPKL
jgi:hypothetical protein